MGEQVDTPIFIVVLGSLFKPSQSCYPVHFHVYIIPWSGIDPASASPPLLKLSEVISSFSCLGAPFPTLQFQIIWSISTPKVILGQYFGIFLYYIQRKSYPVVYYKDILEGTGRHPHLMGDPLIVFHLNNSDSTAPLFWPVGSRGACFLTSSIIDTLVDSWYKGNTVLQHNWNYY